MCYQGVRCAICSNMHNDAALIHAKSILFSMYWVVQGVLEIRPRYSAYFDAAYSSLDQGYVITR